MEHKDKVLHVHLPREAYDSLKTKSRQLGCRTISEYMRRLLFAEGVLP